MSIKRTSIGLTDALFDELDDLISGKSTPQQAKAKAALAMTIISIAKLGMDHARFIADSRNLGTTKLASIPLGSAARK